jgi:hypothetical protein
MMHCTLWLTCCYQQMPVRLVWLVAAFGPMAMALPRNFA